MSNVPAGGFKMMANKRARKPIKRAQRKTSLDDVALAIYHAESVDVSLLTREALVALYIRCVQALASAPEEEEIV